MRSHTAVLLVSVLVICHSVYAAILETNGSYKSCRCTKQTSDFISPRRYESIEIIPLGGACRTTEIILKLKTGQKLCVNPKAPWMQKLLTRIRNQKEQLPSSQDE
ncbi:C-X-C motif chemokine 13-like [Chelonoidis abingdonii]|uniref:C-X-C motif chemokine 13-like n=1 Tax=Chelonoidis abingdonii TaxID=106734 RepID=UPI0013F1FB44|nr:C-X-C motif chemokine 13-like [Chelonoidis abingdonii]